jgi:hypothetical protein
MAKVMRELVKQMTSALKEGKEKGDAVKEGLENALKGGHLSIHEWNLGELFRECYGAEAFDTLKHESAEEIGRFLKLQEAAGGVSTAAFANINKPFAYSAFLEPYSYPEYVFQKLIPSTPLPQGSVKFLQIPGVTNIGRESLVVNEGDAYPVAGVSENYIQTPEVVKKGVVVPITKEAIFFDRTGQVVEKCREVGNALALAREYLAVNCVVDVGESRTNGSYRYRWGKANAGLSTIATYGDNSGTHSWDNLAATNAFTDYTNMNTAWQLLMAQTDPFTGEPIYFQPKHLVVGPSLAFSVPRVLAANITTAVGGYPTSGNPAMSSFTNPVNTVVGAVQPVGTNSMIYEGVNTTASAATTWYLGDLTRAFGYLEAWAPRVDSLGVGTQAEFDRDIVMQFKASEMGTYYTKEPRAIVRCTA